jgi:hypothetical protein
VLLLLLLSELQGKRKDGSTYTIPVNHTFNENQVRFGELLK